MLTIYCPPCHWALLGFPVSWCPVALESESRDLEQAVQFPSSLQGLPGKARGFQLPWTSRGCRSYGLVASTFALFIVAFIGMWRVPATDFINSTISRSEFIATNTMPFSMYCARGIFLTPCVTSCYFSTNVGRRNTAGRAKQHSVSQTAECIHAEMNSQFQSGLKMKSGRKEYILILLPAPPALLPFAHYLPWTGLRQQLKQDCIFFF